MKLLVLEDKVLIDFVFFFAPNPLIIKKAGHWPASLFMLRSIS